MNRSNSLFHTARKTHFKHPERTITNTVLCEKVHTPMSKVIMKLENGRPVSEVQFDWKLLFKKCLVGKNLMAETAPRMQITC